MTVSLPVDYSRARFLDDEMRQHHERLAAILPRDLVAMVEAELPKDADGNTPREFYTDWDADMFTAYLLADRNYAIFKYGETCIDKESFSEGVEESLERVARDNPEVAAGIAAYRATEEARDEMTIAIGLVSTFAEDVWKATLTGDPYGCNAGSGELVFPTEEALRSFVSQIDGEADDRYRIHLAGMGIPVTLPTSHESPTP